MSRSDGLNALLLLVAVGRAFFAERAAGRGDLRRAGYHMLWALFLLGMSLVPSRP
jgi:hypothetical protein